MYQIVGKAEGEYMDWKGVGKGTSELAEGRRAETLENTKGMRGEVEDVERGEIGRELWHMGAFLLV